MGNLYAELDELYKRIPKVYCMGLCQESCGPIMASNLEGRRIKKRAGFLGKVDSHNFCPLLDRRYGRCTVYQIRPAICRMWGATELMPCQFGCVVDPKPLTRDDGLKILMEADAISSRAGFQGSFNTLRNLAEMALKLNR